MIIIINYYQKDKLPYWQKEVVMTLCDGKINHSYIVQSIFLEDATQIRLKALGLTDGTSITILNNKRGGSVIFTVRGTRLAVGKHIAKEIEILSLSEDDGKCKKN